MMAMDLLSQETIEYIVKNAVPVEEVPSPLGHAMLFDAHEASDGSWPHGAIVILLLTGQARGEFMSEWGTAEYRWLEVEFAMRQVPLTRRDMIISQDEEGDLFVERQNLQLGYSYLEKFISFAVSKKRRVFFRMPQSDALIRLDLP